MFPVHIMTYLYFKSVINLVQYVPLMKEYIYIYIRGIRHVSRLIEETAQLIPYDL